MAERGIIQDGWQTWRRELLAIFDRVSDVARNVERVIEPDPATQPQGLHDSRVVTTSRALEAARNSIHRDAFRVILFGDFSSGKSTLINALLREDILPRNANPTTAFTTVVGWNSVLCAELSRDADSSPEMTDVVSYEEFRRQVELRLGDDDKPVASPYVYGAVRGPFSILANHVELIDSAGVNEDPQRERVTMEYLPLVDAVIYVTMAKAAFRQQDQEHYLELLRKHGHEDIFFVVNQMDDIEDKDRRDVERRCKRIARKVSEGREPRIYFTSATNALLARTAPEKADLEEGSGVPQLEQALREFFREGRARLKLQRPAEVIRQEMFRLRESVRDQRGLLNKTAKQLSDALENKVETRRNIERTLRSIDSALALWTRHTTTMLARQTEEFLRSQVDQVNAWAGRARLPSGRFVAQGRNTAVVRLNAHLATHLDQAMRDFSMDRLNAFLQERQDALQNELMPILLDYAIQMEKFEAGLFEAPRTIDDETLRRWLLNMTTHVTMRVDAKPISAQKAGFGLILGGGGVAGGYGLFTTVGLASATAVATVAAPVVLAAVAIPLVIRRFITDRVRADAVREFKQELSENASQIAADYANRFGVELEHSTQSLSAELNHRFQEQIAQVESAIATARAGAGEVESRRRLLDGWEESLAAIERSVSTLARRMLADG
jgi:GTPase Era involved in 16S rRNA processing